MRRKDSDTLKTQDPRPTTQDSRLQAQPAQDLRLKTQDKYYATYYSNQSFDTYI